MSQVSVWSGHGGHRSQQKCGKFIKQRCPFPSSFLFSLLRCLCKVKTKMCACVCFCSMIRNTWTYAVVFIVIQSSDYFAQHCVESSVLDCVQENCRVPAVLLTVVQRRCLKKKNTHKEDWSVCASFQCVTWQRSLFHGARTSGSAIWVKDPRIDKCDRLHVCV